MYTREGGTILRRKIAVILAMGAAVVGAAAMASPANAQSPVPIRLKLGFFGATESKVRDVTESPIFAAEAEVGIPVAQTSVSIGYFYSSKHGNSLQSIPLLINKRFSPPNPLAGTIGNLYYGAGIGAYLVQRGGNDSGNGALFGGRVFVGYQFPNPFFVEGQYHLVAGSVKGLRPNGLYLYGGYRF